MEKAEFDRVGTGPSNTMEVDVKRDLAHKLSTMGWALFFIWVGVAFLVDFGIGVGLLGVGIITLGMQVLRAAFKLKLEGFWLVVGLLFVVGGLWELLKQDVPLLPVFLIVAGLLLLLSIVRGKHRTR